MAKSKPVAKSKSVDSKPVARKRGKPPAVPPAEMKAFLARMNAGVSPDTLAREYGISRPAVLSIYRRFTPPEKRTAVKQPRRAIIPKADYPKIIERIGAGETRVTIAREYGVTREAISQIYMRHTRPNEKLRLSLRHHKRFNDRELRELDELVKSSIPRDHDLHFYGAEAPDHWSEARVVELCVRRFGRKPAMRIVRQYAEKRRPDRFDPDEPPPPPLAHDIRRLSPEMAADKDFVKYYLSDKAWQLTLREHELQVTEWKRRKEQRDAVAAARAAEEPDPDSQIDCPPATGQRVGKHRSSKGTPFTKPKRRKKR